MNNGTNAYGISVDMDDLINKRKMLGEKYLELVEMMKNYRQMLSDTKEIYDTGSANYFRKVADEYMNHALVKMEQEFKAYIDKLDGTINTYTEYNNLIAGKVEKGE